jgi:hypothetical protein
MEQLIELLKQIQELAGVAIEALQGAAEGAPAEGEPGGGGGGGREAPPKEEMAEGKQPPPEQG